MNLSRQYAEIKEEIHAALDPVFEKTAFAGGPFVEQFEERFAPYCEAKCAIGVNSGTSALHLALCALGIQQGDEVIIPANTFIATAWAPAYLGATPVFVDCDPDTWNIDPETLKGKITDRTKAIIGVHLYGQPFDVDAVTEIAREHDLFLVEDSAQAHGARYHGKRVGGLADIAAFSFYPGKNLGAYGEGGAVTTNNESYAEHIKALRDHGAKQKYHHDMLGYNMRMDGLQAAVLGVKLNHIDRWTARRQAIARQYREGINNPKVKMQQTPEGFEPVYHLFVITTDSRERMMDHLKGNNVFPGIHYPIPCHLQKAFQHLGYSKGDLPNTEHLADHCLSLPMFPEMTDEEVAIVIDAVNSYR